jgi:hypothetical protein
MIWFGENGVVGEARRDGWDRLGEVLNDGEVEVRRSGTQEIELDVMDPESGTEWNFARDEDGQWWGCDARGSWHTDYGADVSHAVAAIAEQLADLKEKQAAELASDADDLRQVAQELRAEESAVA